MLTEERFAYILARVKEMGSVTVQQLMAELDASESTIRRDLTTLNANGSLIKVYGGAVRKNIGLTTLDENVKKRQEMNRDSKIRIAKYAAGLIRSDDFIYLDAGTTTEAMIKYIAQGSTTFVTNAVSHARLLAARNFKVYLIGGEFKAITEAIVGEEAVVTLDKYNFTKGFWGANGISIQKGYSTPEVKEALVKQISMENCEECYVLSDDSKLDQVSSVSFASFKSARLITTGNIPQTFLKCANVIRI